MLRVQFGPDQREGHDGSFDLFMEKVFAFQKGRRGEAPLLLLCASRSSTLAGGHADPSAVRGVPVSEPLLLSLH